MPTPPVMTRRIGSPVSGCFSSAASFMLCRISKRVTVSPGLAGIVA
jgi:hypothetical protein